MTPYGATLTWGDNSDSEDDFLLEWGAGGSYDHSAVAERNQTEFTVPGSFEPDTSYNFRVSAENFFSASTAATVSYTASDVPAVPTGLAVNWISAAGVELAWDSPAEEDAVTGFILQVSSNNTSFTSLTTASGDETWAWADHAFAANSTYYFRIAAENGMGQSVWSTSVSATTGSTPSAPTSLSVSAITSGSAAAMSWTDNASNESGFIVEWSTTTSFDAPAGTDYAPAHTGTGTVNFTATGPFDPATSYYFRVMAYNDYDASSASNTVGPITTASYPAAPSDLAAIAVADDEIDLTWTNNATNATGLYLQSSTDGSTWGSAVSLSTSATTYDDGSLTPDTVYYYRLYATNTAGQSACVFIDRATPSDAPDAPTVSAASAWHVDLSWTALTWTNLGGYRVYRGTTDTFTPDQDHLIADGVTGNEYADTSVEPDGVYYYKITGVTTYGDESAASDVSDEVDALAAPTITGDSTADEGDNYGITLTLNGNTINSWDIDWSDGAYDSSIQGTTTTKTHRFMGSTSAADIVAYVYDADGMHELTGPSVTISNLAPTVSISGDSEIDEGSMYTLNLSASDPGDDEITHWVIDWDDGGDAETIWGNPESVDHFFAHHADDPLTISATAFDADGDESDADTHDLTVDDVAATITADWGDAPTANDPYQITLHASDPGGDPVDDITVDWGDGSDLDTVPGGDGVAEHVYTDTGDYTITLDTAGSGN